MRNKEVGSIYLAHLSLTILFRSTILFGCFHPIVKGCLCLTLNECSCSSTFYQLKLQIIYRFGIRKQFTNFQAYTGKTDQLVFNFYASPFP